LPFAFRSLLYPFSDFEIEINGVEDESDLLKDVQARSIEFIKDKISKLNWEQMQTLVADILAAMGYKTRISPQGSDRGKDIIASPDGFGFEQPRIVVEVKHRKEAMGAPEIRSFLGGRHKDDKGLYVSTGGFTTQARYEAERASIPLTLLDLNDLVMAFIENYENMRVSSRTLIPLAKIYWPLDNN
jgi:restriction system protein